MYINIHIDIIYLLEHVIQIAVSSRSNRLDCPVIDEQSRTKGSQESGASSDFDLAQMDDRRSLLQFWRDADDSSAIMGARQLGGAPHEQYAYRCAVPEYAVPAVSGRHHPLV